MNSKNCLRALACAGAVLGGFSASADIPASAYIQDGLVVQFDGIENVGAGLVHDASATSWVDLSGNGRDGTRQGVTSWTSNGLKVESATVANKSVVSFDGSHTAAFTIETCLEVHKSNGAYGRIVAGSSDNNEPALCCNGTAAAVPRVYGFGVDKDIGTTTYNANVLHTSSLLQSGDKNDGVFWYHDGALLGTTSISSTSTGSTTAYLGNRVSDYARGIDATYHSVRIYNRALTANEIAFNSNIDKMRFEGVGPATLTWPDGYRWNSTAGKVEVRVRVSAEGSGTVAVDAAPSVAAGDSWKVVGAQVTLTPNPADGFVFYGWRGDTSGLTVGANGVATYVADGPRELSCCFRPEGTLGTIRTWTGAAGDGQWFTAGNWNPIGVPAVGDEVLIESGTVSLTNATAALLSCTLSGASARMLFAEPVRCAPKDLVTALNARYVTLENGASMSHVTNLQSHAEFKAMENPTWLMDGRVCINCQSLDIDASSKIDVGGRGYYTPKGDLYPANGPGGANGITTGGLAPSYGGWSAATDRFASSFEKVSHRPYGTPEAPVYPGSAGGYGTDASKTRTSPGGGAVRISATGRVRIDGAVLANGGEEGSAASVGDGRKSGTGGAIWISCGSIAGSGRFEANSGTVDSVPANVGSGGRIAIVYDPAQQTAADAQSGVPPLRFSARSLRSTSTKYKRSYSRPGTVYFTDARFLGDTFSSARGVQFGDIRCGDWSGWNPTGSLTLNDAVIEFQEGPALSLDLSGKLSIVGTGSELSIGGGGGMLFTCKPANRYQAQTAGANSFDCGVPRSWSAEPLALAFGSVELGSGAALRILAGPTNETTAARTEVAIAGALELGADSEMVLTCHPTNGAVVRVTAESLRVDAGAGILSDGCGWSAETVGFGPGAIANTGTGAGYGGAADVSTGQTLMEKGLPYGDAAYPVLPGSGGGRGNLTTDHGSAGGGVVWLEIAGDAVVDGVISANGQSQLGNSSGSGSGGSVLLSCRTLTGSGTLRAKGGYGQGAARAGAGGRIAVFCDAAAQKAVGQPDVVYTTGVSSSEDATKRCLADFGTVHFSDATLLGNDFSPVHGVADGFVSIGTDWSEWQPNGLTVSNAHVRFACGGHHLTVNGDVDVFGNAELGFGGGAYACTNSVRRYAYTPGVGPKVTVRGNVNVRNAETSTDAKRCELWMHAGDACGTDGRSNAYGALLEIMGTLAVTNANAMFRPMCHPNTGLGVYVRAKNVRVSDGGSVNADGCGCQGAASDVSWADEKKISIHGGGPGGGRGSGSGGSYGGAGGSGSAAGQGPCYGNAKYPTLGGSGAGWYSGASSGFGQKPGAGGGLVWLEVFGLMHADGVISANGAAPSYDHNGGGSGGGICIRCRTWSVGANAWLSANGGRSGTSSGCYGGGGGRIAVWRQEDLDPTPEAEREYLSVAYGTTSKATSSYMPQNGSTYWRRFGGLMLLVR